VARGKKYLEESEELEEVAMRANCVLVKEHLFLLDSSDAEMIP